MAIRGRKTHSEIEFDARVALPEAQERYERAEAEVKKLRGLLGQWCDWCDREQGGSTWLYCRTKTALRRGSEGFDECLPRVL